MPEHFVPLDVAVKLALSLGVGLLIGLEREWSRKDLGARTFALTALLGTIASLVSLDFAMACLGAVVLLVLIVNGRALLLTQNLEITTSISLVVNFVLGVLIGMGHLFTPIAAALLLTMVLSLKPELTTFAGELRPQEIRSAVLLGLIGFVIYPLLPDRFVDPWNLINPRESWITVIVIAAIGFVNYVLLRLFSDRGLIYTAILGGLVNSTATIAELASWLKEPAEDTESAATLFDFITLVAMFVRNLALLAIFAQRAVPYAAISMVLMSSCAALFVWTSRKSLAFEAGDLKLSSPVSIHKVASFGTLFLAIESAGAIGKRYLGHYGVVIVSFAGGLVSSASTAAAAALLTAHGETTPQIAGIATVVTSIASAISNLPVIYRVTGNERITRALALKTAAVAGIGVAAFLAQSYVRHRVT
jgi:uncharacterized membrane protein (DUF4010 family)